MNRFGWLVRLVAIPLAVQVTVALSVRQSESFVDTSLSKESLQSLTWKPRIFIMSDILNEPDDSMSLVRYLLYANEFDTKGFCAVTSWWLQNETHPEEMQRIIDAYGEVVENLNNHVHPSVLYQDPEELLQLVTTGPKSYGIAALNETLSPGAERIIASLQESEEPLFIAAWGGTNTLAQALQHIDRTWTPSEAKVLRSRIRLYTISDQDDTGAWIRSRYPDIFYIVSVHAFNEYGAATWPGIGLSTCACVEAEKVQNAWLDANIRLGPLGAMYPQIAYTMEGDTPSFLWLVQNGLVYRDHIEWGTWGGRYNRPQAIVDLIAGADGPNHFVNTIDTVIGADGLSYATSQASIWRWREAYQDDFAARMRWTLTSNFTGASHPPVVNVNGHQGPDPLFVRVASNQTYVFNASLTVDTDHPDDNSNLSFQWMLYPEPTRFPSTELDIRMMPIDGAGKPAEQGWSVNVTDAGFVNATVSRAVQITAPPVARDIYTGVMTNFHILLQVTNTAGLYPVRRYLRVVCEYDE